MARQMFYDASSDGVTKDVGGGAQSITEKQRKNMKTVRVQKQDFKMNQQKKIKHFVPLNNAKTAEHIQNSIKNRAIAMYGCRTF